MNLRELDNVAFQIEVGFSNQSGPVDDLSILEDYNITTDRNAFINLFMSPRDPLAQYQFAHIRIFTSASTVMGSISI